MTRKINLWNIVGWRNNEVPWSLLQWEYIWFSQGSTIAPSWNKVLHDLQLRSIRKKEWLWCEESVGHKQLIRIQIIVIRDLKKLKDKKIKNVKKIVREIGWIASLNPTFTNPLKASTSCCRKMTLHFPLLSYCTTTSGPCTWPLKNDTYVTFLVCIIILNNYSWFCQSIICYLLKLLNHITFMACLEV